MKNWLSPRAHFEPARGTDLQNDEYCSKGGDVYLRIGEPGRERRRNDLLRAVDVAKSSGGSMRAVAEACPQAFIRYGRGLRERDAVPAAQRFQNKSLCVCWTPRLWKIQNGG